jgi:hypothetical protein
MGCTREQAFKIAESYLAAHPMPYCVGISKVYDYDQIRSRRFNPYGCRIEKLEDYWIAYAEHSLGVLRSSDVILVSKEDGSVGYAGGISDEG